MARDTDAQPPEKTEQPDDTPQQQATETGPQPEYEPFPGEDFFHGGRASEVFVAMGRRLVQEDCGRYGDTGPGPDWTNAHRRSFAAWQEKLRPKGGGDTSGTPDRVAWDKLHVPKVS